jgi:hypothetical protein
MCWWCDTLQDDPRLRLQRILASIQTIAAAHPAAADEQPPAAAAAPMQQEHRAAAELARAMRRVCQEGAPLVVAPGGGDGVPAQPALPDSLDLGMDDILAQNEAEAAPGAVHADGSTAVHPPDEDVDDEVCVLCCCALACQRLQLRMQAT